MVAKIILIGIIVGTVIGITSGVSYLASDPYATINDDDDEYASKISVQDLEPYGYEDVCGFPVTD